MIVFRSLTRYHLSTLILIASQLKKIDVQPTLPKGHYVLGVKVTSGKSNKGQTVATGDMA